MFQASSSSTAPTVGRRSFLKGVGALGAGLALAGCDVSTSSGEDTGDAAPSFDIELPDTGAELPTEDMTIRWLNGGPGPKTYFFTEFNKAYHKAHPNITVQYDELPNPKIGEVLPLQLRNGDVADVFLVINVPMGELVASGRLAALDDVIPDFDEWVEGFPFGMLAPGVQQFDGKTYAVTPSSDRRTTLMLYNTEYMEAAGFDPANETLSWDDFRDAAKKITQQGGDDYYGLMLPDKFQGVMLDVAQLSGARLGDSVGQTGAGLDWQTGTYNFHADQVVEFVELLQAMLADGSIVPGWASRKDQEARASMAQGEAGMILSGPWNFPVWNNQNPDFRYGVSRHPAQDPSAPAFATYAVGGSNQFAVYADAPADHKAVAGDMLYYLGTESGQRAWNRLTGAADPAWSPDAMKDVLESDVLDKSNRTALTMFDETVRLAPSAMMRNADAQVVELEFKAAKPNLAEVVQGVMLGELRDAASALKDLSDRSEKALDDAIKAAQSKGARVSRDDWAFANWDVSKDYGQAEYDSL